MQKKSQTKICRDCVCLQKIYLFAPEGSSQDRSRSRPPPAPAASPAKRAKTGNLDEGEQEQQLKEADEPREEEDQTQEADADEMAAERSSTSENPNCISQWLPAKITNTAEAGALPHEGASALGKK